MAHKRVTPLSNRRLCGKSGRGTQQAHRQVALTSYILHKGTAPTAPPPVPLGRGQGGRGRRRRRRCRERQSTEGRMALSREAIDGRTDGNRRKDGWQSTEGRMAIDGRTDGARCGGWHRHRGKPPTTPTVVGRRRGTLSTGTASVSNNGRAKGEERPRPAPFD